MVLTDAGFQVWWYVAPMIINTFLESYGLTGKTIISFATSGGSNMKKTNERLAPSFKGEKLLEGKAFIHNVSRKELASWGMDLYDKRKANRYWRKEDKIKEN